MSRVLAQVWKIDDNFKIFLNFKCLLSLFKIYDNHKSENIYEIYKKSASFVAPCDLTLK